MALLRFIISSRDLIIMKESVTIISTVTLVLKTVTMKKIYIINIFDLFS